MLLECSAASVEVALPHRCPGHEADSPISYQLGPRGRTRLAEGETLPVTARCPRCDGRVFVSLVDPGARERRLAGVRFDPGALRAPSRRAEPARRFDGPPLDPTPTTSREPCPACGLVPDSFGLCRCSA
ncbi:MAG TPA: hypothetical protein VG370_31340 [Chloroflexota bacterium]|nr:hypothetical protein [Chloroflexota bacterium]